MAKYRDRMQERQIEVKDQHDKTSRTEDITSLYTGHAVRILHHQKKTLFRWHRSGHVQRATTNDSAHRVRRVECWPSTRRTYSTSPCWHRSASHTQPWTMATTGARHSWGIVNQLIETLTSNWHDLLFTSFTDTLVSFLTMFWTHGLLNYLFTYLFVYFNCIMDF